MIRPEIFYSALKKANVDFFTGVPDSLLKPFCAYVSENTSNENHVICPNEGSSIGLATGYHLATGKIPLVYMQNSGLGNAINPLASLADKEVYSIPMLLMIGWRGEPLVKDEPQHIKQGKVTEATLAAMDIPYRIIDKEEETSLKNLNDMIQLAINESRPCAILIRKGAFCSHPVAEEKSQTELTREDAIKKIAGSVESSDLIVATTGMASRELFEYREESLQSHDQDFLTVGGMGHASQIALGIAKAAKSRRVICVDGDGAVLMHMGALAISGQSNCKNFKHIVLNNGAHDSVGGQPTVALDINLTSIAEACGYRCFEPCLTSEDIERTMPKLLNSEGPCFVEIFVRKGNRADLGRPSTSPKENKVVFMDNLRGS